MSTEDGRNGPGEPDVERGAEAGLSADQAELEDARSRYLRLAADFENFKKRSRQEQADLIQYATASMAETLLPVLDDLERALQHVPDDVDRVWLKGVELTAQKLTEVLEGQGVARIEAVGAAFDPALHEAVASEESHEHPDDTVVDELRPGYRMHERVLRPAMVRVSRTPAAAEPS